MQEGRSAQRTRVRKRLCSLGRVEDEVHLAILDCIDDVGPAFEHLVDAGCGDPLGDEVALRPVGGENGEAELGIQLISEIVSVPGAELLGPLPAELQAMTVISAGIVMTASEPDAAKVLFKFLTSPAAATVIKATGMEPDWLGAHVRLYEPGTVKPDFSASFALSSIFCST